jgi:ATPase family associated with various cellular activities (AAA)
MTEIGFVPLRFRKSVLQHALGVRYVPGYPMFLAIQGPPGDGKSFQAALTLQFAEIGVFRLSGSLLSGEFERDSVNAVRNLYKSAAKHAGMPGPEGGNAALLLEDFDLSPASQRDGTRYTVNSQLLTGFLMNLHDDVASCEVETARRIPIYLTGNDFSYLHSPLVRHGRIEFFTWEPTPEERADIVFTALADYVMDIGKEDVVLLCKKHSSLPVSAFAAAAQRVCSAALYDKLVQLGREKFDALTKTPSARQVLQMLQVPLSAVEAELKEQVGANRRPRKFGVKTR